MFENEIYKNQTKGEGRHQKSKYMMLPVRATTATSTSKELFWCGSLTSTAPRQHWQKSKVKGPFPLLKFSDTVFRCTGNRVYATQISPRNRKSQNGSSPFSTFCKFYFFFLTKSFVQARLAGKSKYFFPLGGQVRPPTDHKTTFLDHPTVTTI